MAEGAAPTTIITWNAANWITIVLMVALGFFVMGALVKVLKLKTTGQA